RKASRKAISWSSLRPSRYSRPSSKPSSWNSSTQSFLRRRRERFLAIGGILGLIGGALYQLGRDNARPPADRRPSRSRSSAAEHPLRRPQCGILHTLP